MNEKVYIVHGWKGYSEEGWFPWLKKSLEELGFSISVLDLPDSKNPQKEPWISALSKALQNPDEKTYFVGHSLGCQCIVRYLETLPKGVKVGGAVFVAGFFQALTNFGNSPEELNILKNWLGAPIDFQKAHAHLLQSITLFSDDDPFVPLQNAEDFEKKLGSKICIEQGKGHFNGQKEFPEILDALLHMIKNPIASPEDFQKIDMRVGKIIAVEDLPNPKHTTHKITVDFGKELGIKISGARLLRYSHAELLGRLVICVVNLPKKQIGKIFSEVYTLGVAGNEGEECILLTPENPNANLGERVY